MRLGNTTIGCENTYAVCITDSCRNVVANVAESFICGGTVSNVLDDIGRAEVELTGKHGLWDRICLGRHYLEVKRNGVVEFHGPITRVESFPTRIIAQTPLWWTKKRIRSPNATGPQVYDTPIEMFEGVVLQPTNKPDQASDFGGCDSMECEPDFSPLCYARLQRLDGGERAIAPVLEATDNTESLYSLLQEHADSFLDYTEIGGDLLYGYQQVPIPENRQQARPKLTTESWCEKPSIVRDIEDFSTDVSIATDQQDLGSTPFLENGYYRKRLCCQKFGTHQTIEVFDDLDDVNQIIDAANSALPNFCDNRDITFIENLNNTALDPSVAWDTPRQVPGMLVDVDLRCDLQGIEITETLRLVERIIEFGPGVDSSKITLGPI